MSPSPTIGERLAAYKTRGVHIADIKNDPMVRALYWRGVEKAAELLMKETRFSPDHGHLFDQAEREAEIARAARAAILTGRSAFRWWAGLPTVSPINHIGLTAADVAGAKNLGRELVA